MIRARLGIALALVLIVTLSLGCQPRRRPNTALLVGARASSAQSSIGAQSRESAAYQGGVAWSSYTARGWLTVRQRAVAFIGGSEEGIAGELGGSVFLGPRFRIDDQHGVIARDGANGDLMGAPATRLSLLEVPALELGYQFRERAADMTALHAEIAPRVGLGIAGLHGAGPVDTTHGLAPIGGLNGTIRGNLFSLDGGYTRSFSEQPIDVVRLGACGGLIAVLCGDVRYSTSEVDVEGRPRRLEGVYAGVSLGFGWVLGSSWPF